MRFVLDEVLINDMLTAIGCLPYNQAAPLVERVHAEALIFHEAKVEGPAVEAEFEVVTPTTEG